MNSRYNNFLIPEIPKEIINAANIGKLAVFVGAGVSIIAGCQNWEKLADSLVSKAQELEFIDFEEEEIIKKFPDKKKRIDIIRSIFEEKGKKDEFMNLLCEEIQPKGEGKKNIYQYIYNLGGVLITTNADKGLDNYFSEDRIRRGIDKPPDNELSRSELFKIHGCILDHDSLVFTTKQYLDNYRPKSNLHSFLEYLFGNYTVLFIGSSVSEMELLQYVVTNGKIKNHYWLRDFFFGGTARIREYEKKYYEQLKIEIIEYDKTSKGYNVLIDILKEWSEKMRKVTNLIPKAWKEIDDAIKRTEAEN